MADNIEIEAGQGNESLFPSSSSREQFLEFLFSDANDPVVATEVDQAMEMDEPSHALLPLVSHSTTPISKPGTPVAQYDQIPDAIQVPIVGPSTEDEMGDSEDANECSLLLTTQIDVLSDRLSSEDSASNSSDDGEDQLDSD